MHIEPQGRNEAQDLVEKLQKVIDNAACGQAEALKQPLVAPAAPPLALDLGYGDEVDDECCMCMEAPPVATLIPCQHTCVCSTCAAAVMDSDKLCPLCRQPVAKFEVKSRNAKLANLHFRCRKRLARTWWTPWKLAVETARAQLLSSVDQGMVSLDTAQKTLELADFDGSLKAINRAVQHFDAARRWVLPLHADVSSDSGDDFAAWITHKISNAQHRCKLLKKGIDSDGDRRNFLRKEMNALSNETGTKKSRDKLKREMAQLDRQIEANQRWLVTRARPLFSSFFISFKKKFHLFSSLFLKKKFGSLRARALFFLSLSSLSLSLALSLSISRTKSLVNLQCAHQHRPKTLRGASVCLEAPGSNSHKSAR